MKRHDAAGNLPPLPSKIKRQKITPSQSIQFPTEDFLCPICCEPLSPPLTMCMGCTKNFHKKCILRWLQTKLHVHEHSHLYNLPDDSEKASCPLCNAAPMRILDNRTLDQILECIQQNSKLKCKFCNSTVTTEQVLHDHYALCTAYQRRLSQRTYKRAEFIWELLSKTTPQASVQLHYPDAQSYHRVELNIPDRRENPQELNFVLFIRKHRKRENYYLFEMHVLQTGSQALRFPLRIGAILAFDIDELQSVVKTVNPTRETTLFKINSSKKKFRLWICAF